MTGLAFITYVRNRTRTDSTTFPDAEALSYANPIKDELATLVEAVDEEYFGMPSTTDLLATDTTREYPFPGDMLNKMKYLEANLKADDTCDDNWVRLEELDLNTYKRTTDETTIQGIFGLSEDTVFFDIFRGSIWLYTGEIEDTVTDGLKLWAFDYPADIDASDLADDTTDLSVDPSTTSHGFPRALHRVWADAVVIEYKTSRDKPIPLTEREQRWEFYRDQALDTMRRMNRDRAAVYDVPSDDANDDGYEF